MSVDIYPLTDAWKPSKLLFRDEQLKNLIKKIEEKYTGNYWIYGPRGSGKTLTMEILEDKVNALGYGKVIRVLCQKSSVKRTIADMLLKLNVAPTGNIEVKSFNALRDLADKYNKIILIFDEIDAIGKFIRQYFSPYLHTLYDTVIKHIQLKFSVFLVSTLDYEKRNKYIIDTVESRYLFKPLFFNPYKKDEMKTLLKQRLEHIENLKWDEKAVDFICEKVSRQIGVAGDFRKVLELTRRTIQQTGTFDFKAIEKVWIEDKTNFWANKIRSLSYHEALMLACIVVETKKVMEESKAVDEPPLIPVSWNKVKEIYENSCRKIRLESKDLDPLSPKMQYYILEKLWRTGWIEKFVLSRYHDWNYIGKRSLFIRLNEKLENLESALKKINLYKPW